jgi:hypothetical protein
MRGPESGAVPGHISYGFARPVSVRGVPQAAYTGEPAQSLRPGSMDAFTKPSLVNGKEQGYSGRFQTAGKSAGITEESVDDESISSDGE